MQRNKNQPQKYEKPKAKFRKDGSNSRDRSDKFTRTKGVYTNKMRLKQPSIISYGAASSAAALEDASRRRAYRKSLRNR